MNICVAYDDGQVAKQVSDCRSYLLVTTDGSTPIAKRLLSCANSTDMLKQMSMAQVDVLICGGLGLAARNALEMLGVLLIPGVEGAAEEAVAKFLVGEKQGDPTILEIAREEDPDDPMACMHDCAKCAGCAPLDWLKTMPQTTEPAT